MKEKTFLKAIQDIPFKPKKLKFYLKDKRITHSEKIVLTSLADLRDNKFQEIIDNLSTLTLESSLVDGIRNMVLGMAYNNRTDYITGADYLAKALNLIDPFPARFSKLIILNALFYCYLNNNDKNNLKKTLRFLNSFTSINPWEKVLICRANLNEKIYNQDYTEAEFIIKELESMVCYMSESQQVSFFIDKIDYFSKTKKIKEARDTLEESKKNRKFYLSATYKLFKLFIDYLIDNKKFYIYKADFESYPTLFHQAMVIKFLDESDRSNAFHHWSALKKQAPWAYGDNYDYLAEQSLFSLCLEKVKSKLTFTDEINVSLPDGPIEKRLLHLLENTSSPIKKEIVYELVWGEDVQSKEDLAKLATAIYRLKTKYSLNISYSKGCYHLIQSLKSKKVS